MTIGFVTFKTVDADDCVQEATFNVNHIVTITSLGKKTALIRSLVGGPVWVEESIEEIRAAITSIL